MITTGIIKEINGENIVVEMFNADSHSQSTSCSSGNCAGCSAAGKGKLINAANTKKLPIKTGTLIEMEVSSLKALLAGFRVLILPLLLFIAVFMLAGNVFHTSEGLQVASGFTGLGAGFLLNIFFSRKNRIKEMPVIVRIL